MDSFHALSDLTRRQIIVMLAEHGELAASRISQYFNMTAPAISQHLKILREARLVHMEKRAQQRIYRMNPEGLAQVEDWIWQINKIQPSSLDSLEIMLRIESQKPMHALELEDSSIDIGYTPTHLLEEEL